jgi:hypothetical protein
MSHTSIKSLGKSAGLVDLLLFYQRQQETVGKDKCIKNNDGRKCYTV